MAISVEQLEQLVIDHANAHDDVLIISGYFSSDVIEDIAKTGKNVTFYYGMYPWSQITTLQHNSFQKLESLYSNLTINIVTDYHVHTKCYLFTSPTDEIALIGSANCSSSGLLSDKNCEMLIDVNDSTHIADLKKYASEIDSASVHYDDPIIVPYVRGSTSRKRISTYKGRNYSGNPFVANIPLYVYKGKRKVVPKGSGINWGLQKGHTSTKSVYAEAYIPIKTFDLKYNAAMFPPCGAVGAGAGGKKTRRLSPVTVTWDDGTVMTMLFQGTQEYPSAGSKTAGPRIIYPKQLSENTGGSILGEYLRKRMGVPPRKMITISDFKKYGRDYITLTYISPGNYEADFRP